MCVQLPQIHNAHAAETQLNGKAAAHRAHDALARVVNTGSPFPGASPRNVSRLEVLPGTRGAIAAALATAEEHSTVVLSPGVYLEDAQLIIPAGLTLVCDRPFDDKQLLNREDRSPGSEARIMVSCSALGNIPFVCIRERGCMLKNIVFEVTEDEERDHRQFPCLDISGQSDAIVEKCGVVCENRSGIRVKGTATARIEGCTLACSKEGILIQGNAAPMVCNNVVAVNEVAIRAGQNTKGRCEGNSLEAGRDACIVGEGRSKTVFVDNMLTIDAASKFGCAVVVRNSSQITLERNHVTGSHYNGMQIGDCSNPIVKENVIAGSRASGIVMHEYATGVFVRNRIERSKLAGIGIRDNAEPYLKGNVICDGDASGVVIMGEARCIFEENKIKNNKGSGVRITAKSSDVLFDGNQISNNRACGFWLDGECASTLQNNKVLASERAGIYVTQKAAPRVSHNVVSEGDTAGILLDDHAGGDFNNNVISKNAACNVMLGGRSKGVFESNLVSGSPSGGILCFSESECVLLRNRVEDNAIANIAVLDNAQPTVKHNSIKNGSGRGLVVGGGSKGVFANNSIVGNQHEGMYIGGHAKPTLDKNSVSENGAAGMVIEDWAEGVFTDNVFRDNDSAAVAVQGHSKPTLERTVIKHNGNGGIWLMERAGGVISATTMDDESFEGAWKRGVRVRTRVVAAKVDAPAAPPTSSGETRLPSIGRLGPSSSARSIALICNPGSAARHSIAAFQPPSPRRPRAASPRPVALPELQVACAPR